MDQDVPGGARDPDRRRPVRRQAINYVYDLGAYWEHEITLEKKLPLDPEQAYPACVASAGDSPAEYPQGDYEDEAEDPTPFDLDEVNRRLAGDDYS